MEVTKQDTKKHLANKITGGLRGLQDILHSKDLNQEDNGVLHRDKEASQVTMEVSLAIRHTRAGRNIKDFPQVTKRGKQEQVLNIKDGVLLNELQNH